MRLTTERNQRIVSGAIGLLVLFALITVGIKGSFGAFDGGYQLQGTFAAAGQVPSATYTAVSTQDAPDSYGYPTVPPNWESSADLAANKPSTQP